MAKPTSQELYCVIANLMIGEKAETLMFSGNPFKRRFWVHEPERGHYVYLEELPRNVLAFTTEEAIINEVLAYVTGLPADFHDYKFTYDKAKACVKFWQAQRKALLTKKIWPVLQLSQEGYCYHRLDFDAKAGPHALFDSFMEHVETNQEALKAFIGALTDPDFSRQFYLWVHGPGGDGKGSLFWLIGEMYQRAYMALPSDFRQFNQFFVARCVGCRVGAFQDCHNPKLPQHEIFMQLTGGDRMVVENKNEAPYMTDIDTCIMVSSNKLPILTGSEAHQRRAIICTMRKRTTYDGSKGTYRKRLWEERAAILHTCIAAWERMKAEHGDMVACREIAAQVAEDAETKWEGLTNAYFVVDVKRQPSLKPCEVNRLLKTRERLNDIEIGEFYAYLERRGCRIRTNPKPRMWLGLHLQRATDGQREVQEELPPAPTF